MGRRFCNPMVHPSDLSFIDSLKSESRKYFYEHHETVAIAMVLVVFLLPLIGAFSRGLSGAATGAVISTVTYYLMPYITHRFGG